MSVVITPNKLNTRDNLVPSPALKDDGTGFAWRMFYDSNRLIADMDAPGEALELLQPGYMAFTSEEKFQERVRLAQTVRTLARSTILANLTDDQLQSLQPWEKQVLLYSEDPYGWGNGESATVGETQDDEVLDIWSSEIPLVLITTSYAPHTDILKPLSSEGDYEEVRNIIWLRPEDELTFLNSLSRIGFITFGVPQHQE